MTLEIRGFYHISQSPHSYLLKEREYEDEVMFGMYYGDGGSNWEIAIRWYKLQGVLTPRLEIFNDGFLAIRVLPDVFEQLERWNEVDFTPQEFCNMLLDHGFTKLT